MHVIVFLVWFLLACNTARGLSCQERDYCNGTILDYRGMNESKLIKERNCFCDRACFQYDDCCEDIKPQRKQEQIQANCVDYIQPFRIRSQVYTPTVMPVWMITNCLSNYQYTELEKSCTSASEDSYFSSDPPIYIPMTSRETNFTYRNIYCALCHNEHMDSLINWSFQIVCSGLKQNYQFRYETGLNMMKLPPQEAEGCINRLSFPPSPALVYPCKQQTISSCPSSFSGNQTLVKLCSTINAYRYVTRPHPVHMHDYSLFRNEHCLRCQNLTDDQIDQEVESSCEHQLDDELMIDPKPKTGRHGVYRLSILFDPHTFSSPMPILSLADHRQHSSYQTHFTRTYPCRYFEVYDYFLHSCSILPNEFDWRLIRAFNCTNTILVRNDIENNETVWFYSQNLSRKNGDFIRLFSDEKKLIICGERFPLLYIHHNRFITTIRYSSTIISLLSLLIFIISFTQNSNRHHLPGKCLFMFAVSLHLSQSMFLASGHLLDHTNRFWCVTSGISVHLFYLSSFAWLSAISFDTSLTLTRMNRLDKRVAQTRFILYNIFVWTFSSAIVFISVSLHFTLSASHSWSPNYGGILCSISSANALMAFFLCPIGSLVLVNVVIYTRTVFVVHRIDRETRVARSSEPHRSRSFLYFRLSMLMGIHWILLVVCLIFKRESLWAIFDFINCFPGLFIAVNFLRKQKTLADIKSRIRSSQSQLSSLAISSSNINRGLCSANDASPSTQMNRRLDDITQKLDHLTLHLLKPNGSFQRSASSSI